MNPHQHNMLRRVAKRLDGTIYRHYSGRAMFGRCCPGIVYEGRADCKFPKLLGQPMFDRMGLDTIVYFPSVNDPR